MTERLKYHNLTSETQERILADRARGWVNPYRTPDSAAVRRNPAHDVANLWRPAFVRDIEKILHLPYYNRYADKTQVFSFYNNDDITRRGLHVQLVSRIARNIGAVLGLNLDLIEAIALGHDIGHTPFGHAGERFLSEITEAETGRAFNHNVQSVRVLDAMFARNFTLQTLDGVLCHNGEFEQQKYRPMRDNGTTEDEFYNTAKSWYRSGTELVFASGETSASVIKAAEECNGRVICSDSDHSSESNLVVTSAMKMLEKPLVEALNSLKGNSYKWDADHSAKSVLLGLDDGAVGLATDAWRFGAFSIDAYENIAAKIVAGEIKVSTDKSVMHDLDITVDFQS